MRTAEAIAFGRPLSSVLDGGGRPLRLGRGPGGESPGGEDVALGRIAGGERLAVCGVQDLVHPPRRSVSAEGTAASTMAGESRWPHSATRPGGGCTSSTLNPTPTQPPANCAATARAGICTSRV